MTEERTGSVSDDSGDPVEEYVEEYVEVVDNRRKVIILSIVLLVLLLLFAVLLPRLWSAVRPPGTPAAAEVSTGMRWIRSIYGWGDTEADMLKGPSAVAVAPNGDYWTVSNNRIMVGFDGAGRLSRRIQLPEGEGEGRILSIEGIGFDDDGSMYVVDYGGAKVIKLDPSGEYEGEIKVAFPSMVAVKDGVVAISAQGGVALFDSVNGELITQWGARGPGVENFDGARGLAFAEDGTLFVADTLNKRVKAYTQEGRLLWAVPSDDVVEAARELTEPGEGEPTAPDVEIPFQLPSDLVVDSAGRIILTDPFNFEVMALDPKDGSITDTWGEVGAADGSFGYPTGIAYDAGRDYFVVADTANNRLQVFALSGSGGGLGATAARLASTPFWICLFPLLLLLVLLILPLARARKRAKREKDDSTGAGLTAR